MHEEVVNKLFFSHYLCRCDLEIESSAHYYTSFRGTEIAGDSNFRNGRKFCTLAGFAAVSFLSFSLPILFNI
jgi:hypothetical protein